MNKHAKFKKTKKGNVTWVLTVTIISILGFFVYLSFFADIASSLTSETNDLACRIFLGSKDTALSQTRELFFSELKQKCKKDEIKETVKSKEEVFETVADSMKRCYYRYGEGEYEFLSFWNKEGNWCFVCANINVQNKNDENQVYSYSDFIKWTQDEENSFELRNKSKSTYYNYINMQYSEVENEEEIRKTRENIDQLLEEGEGYMKNLALLYDEKYKQMQDLRLKEIPTGEDLYVVYRYDKTDNNSAQMSQAITGALIGAGVSIAGSMGAEFVADKVMTVAICGSSLFTGIGAPFICGGAVLKSMASSYKSIKNAVKLQKLRKIIEKLETFFTKTVNFSKKARKTKILDTFTGSIDEMPSIIKKLEKVNPELAKKMANIEKKMQKIGIKHFDELDFNNLDDTKLNDIKDMAMGTVNMNLFENYELEKEVIEIFGNKNFKEVLKADKTKFEKVKEYLKLGVIGASTIAGGTIGANLNFESNQYVDIMTKEQYYRICGTERSNYK